MKPVLLLLLLPLACLAQTQPRRGGDPLPPGSGIPGRPAPRTAERRGELAQSSSTVTVADAVVQIRNVGAAQRDPRTGMTRMPAGSGVCVHAENGVGLILTARHIYHASQTTIVFPDGQSYTADQVLHHPSDDLTAVVFRYGAQKPVTVGLAWNPPNPGDSVWKIGYPGLPDGTSPRDIRNGRVLSIGYRLRASALIRSGDSGGGVFDRNGRLVGIAVSHSGDHQTEAVPTRTCYSFVVDT